MNATVALCLLLFPMQEQDPARDSIRADDLKKHVETLASDDLEGRNAGTEGAKKAAQYLADRFKEYGLRPPTEGDFFQRFTFPLRDDGKKRLLIPQEASTVNVIGVVNGGDLAGEVVVVGAHYDHVGKRGQANPGRRDANQGKGGDDVWNGADDNASGTAAMLELAQAFSTLKPRRTIVFIAFGAEEHGLLGSDWYRRHPLFPLDKTALMVNLDTIGREPERGVEICGVGMAEGLRAVVEKGAKENDLKAELFDFGEIREADSDAVTFFEAGVPALWFFTGLHEDYHESTDHADKLNYPSMERIARTAFRVVRETAEAAERPKFRAPRRLGLVVRGDPMFESEAKRLGLEKDRGALPVVETAKGSAAEAAGVKAGDWIVEFAGKKLPFRETRRGFRRALEAVAAGSTVPLAVLRDGKRVELQIEIK